MVRPHWSTVLLAATVLLLAAALYWTRPSSTARPVVHTRILTVPATPPETGCAPVADRYDPASGLTMACSP